MSQKSKKFSPFEIFEELKSANLDPSIFEKVDERDFAKAPNFLDWALEPKFASTTVLPKQIEIGTKLCQDWCPRCSNPGYIDQLFDQTIGNIKDNIMFLNHGVCPKCHSNRVELANEFDIEIKNELAGAMGQRCVPKGTLVYTCRGTLPIEEMKVGDQVSHGRVSEIFDSGEQDSLEIITEHNWTVRGALDTHVVAYLHPHWQTVAFKLMKNVEIGDTLLLCAPELFPEYEEAEHHSALPSFSGSVILSAPRDIQIRWASSLLGTTSIYDGGLRFYTTSRDTARMARLVLLNLRILTKCHVDGGWYKLETVPGGQSQLLEFVGKKHFPVKVVEKRQGPRLHMYDVHVPGLNAYTGDGFLHHNSGKTKLVGLLASYLTHRFLKVPNPLRYFGQPTGELLLGTFSALTLEQASQTLWESYKGFVNGSPWFSQYHDFLKGEGKRLGVELIHDLKTSTLYSHKQMLWHATGSQDRKMRGKTRIFAAIDELGWFIMDESKPDLQNMNADGVYTALANSLATMRMKYRILLSRGEYDAPPILMANVSSPSSAKDKIMRLIKDASRNRKILAVALPTWLCNPDYTYETLREEFNHIEESIFMRDFGVEPPLAQNPFISDATIVERLARGSWTQDFDAAIHEDVSSMFRSVRTTVKSPSKSIPRLLTLDLGATKNGLAACMFAIQGGKPTLEYVLSIVPTQKLRINIADVYDHFTEVLIKNFDIKYVFFDRWQSLDQIERIRALGVEAEVYSLTYRDMDSVRGYINSEAVVIPRLRKSIAEVVQDYVSDSPQWNVDAIATLCVQLLTVRDNGHRMMKPLQGDDDIFRAFCLGVVKAFDPKIKAALTRAQAVTLQQSGPAMGSIISRSNGARGGGVLGGGALGGIAVSMSRSTRRR